MPSVRLSGRGPPKLFWTSSLSDIEETHVSGVALDESTARFDVLTHQNGEDFVGGCRIVHRYLHQGAAIRVHCGVPQLRVVHFTQALIPLDAVVFRDAPATRSEERRVGKAGGVDR